MSTEILTKPAAGETGTIVPVLSVTERAVLLECEAKVRLGLKAFVDVGNALAKIRDERLYRERFGTFEAYCLAVWDISDRHARYLWNAAEVVDELAAHNFTVLPETESQARPLTKLPRVEWVETWHEVLAGEGGKVTANRVSHVVQRRLNRLNGHGTEFVQKPVVVPTPQPVDVGTREDRIRAAADEALAKLRSLQDLVRTADGEATANVALSISHMDQLRDHVTRVEKLHANRKAAA